MKPSLIIIGLGNVGAQYTFTRHNVGFRAVEKLGEEFGEGDWKDKGKFKAFIKEGRVVTAPILLAKPQTFMNLSGESVKKLVDFYKLDPEKQILVICDDVDLPLGEVRLRQSGGPGTHNGLKSIVEIFGEEFPRLRIGIGAQPAGKDLSNWVLSVPSEEEAAIIQKAVDEVPEIVRELIIDN